MIDRINTNLFQIKKENQANFLWKTFCFCIIILSNFVKYILGFFSLFIIQKLQKLCLRY